MPPSESLVERYRNAGIALVPPGRALTKVIGAKLSNLVEALSVEWARLHEEAEASAKRDALPSGAVDNLDQWEEAFGLPGECVDDQGSDDDRRAALVTRLLGRTSHAQAAFESAAERLGYTDLVFERVSFFEAGSSGAGDEVVSDEWAHYVRAIVPVGSQTADEVLRCTFVDELRRSHGFVDVILEGPMGATRVGTTYMNPASQSSSPLAVDGVVSTLAAIPISYSGFMSIQCTIDNGAGGAPTDNPQGVWELYTASDGTNYTKVDAADAELAKIKPNGNNKVDAVATFTGVPGTSVKVRYNQSSGGGGDSRVRMQITTW